MSKDIHILLIEDDLYARDLMTLLLTRDWRTRVIGELGTEDSAREYFENKSIKIDAVLIDTEVPGDPDWPFRLAEMARKQAHPPKILATGTKPNPVILSRLVEANFSGYILKKEIRYSLASAITLAVKQNNWVITPSIYRSALAEHIQLPENVVILDGSKPFAKFTQREDEVARLAILFNLAHRDLADELVIRADQVSKYVSNAYSKLGLEEILHGEIMPSTYFQDKVVLTHFQDILSRIEQGEKRKTSDMATLAFHLLTMPDIKEQP